MVENLSLRKIEAHGVKKIENLKINEPNDNGLIMKKYEKLWKAKTLRK